MREKIGLFLSILGSFVLYSGCTILLILKYGIERGYLLGTIALILVYAGNYLLFKK